MPHGGTDQPSSAEEFLTRRWAREGCGIESVPRVAAAGLVSRIRVGLTTKAVDAPAGQGARTPAYSSRTPRTSNAALRDAAAADCQANADSGH